VIDMPTTLRVLGRVHRHLTGMYGYPTPYEITILKRVVVCGICRDYEHATIEMISALTCETPEEVHRMINSWRRMDAKDRDYWIRIATEPQ